MKEKLPKKFWFGVGYLVIGTIIICLAILGVVIYDIVSVVSK